MGGSSVEIQSRGIPAKRVCSNQKKARPSNCVRCSSSDLSRPCLNNEGLKTEVTDINPHRSLEVYSLFQNLDANVTVSL